ncbi:MAG: extracellular solute-binding protein [Parcubacteria group bacterium]|nr:extracellular solute-binding protein [Parcubacteria group bacterium]
MQLTQQQKLIAGAVVVVLVLGLASIPFILKKVAKERVVKSLKVWVVGDDKSIYEPIYPKFGLPIELIKKDYKTYERELVDALASGDGPDVFMIHNSWLPKHQSKLAPAPAELLTPFSIQKNFPDVVTTDFVRDGKIYALPLSIDTLALFYDKDVFNGAFISAPPRTWGELGSIATRLTKRDAGGNIIQSGVALGAGDKSVDKASHILPLLMMQKGVVMVRESGKSYTPVLSSDSGGVGENPAVDALNFYLQFSDPLSPLYTWDSSQHYSIDAFSYNPTVRNKVAMILSYWYQIAVMKGDENKKGKNPNLNFGVAQMPQRDDVNESQYATYADYWGYAVAKSTKDPKMAWSFVQFLTSKAQAQQYLVATKRPPALRSLISSYQDDPILSVFANQILIAKSWIQPGASDANPLFSQAIDQVTRGQISSNEAIQSLRSQLQELFSRITL